MTERPRDSSLSSTDSTICQAATGAQEADQAEKGEANKELKDEVEAAMDRPKDEESDEEIEFVHWAGADDPQNPYNWGKKRKWIISSTGIVFCGLVSMAVSGYSISQGSVITELHTSKELAIAGITFFTLMFGSAPMVFSPLSEVYGRNGIYLISAFMFTIFFIPQALAKNIQTILVSRFFAGTFGSSAVALVGGTLSDVWRSEDRALPMALFSYAAFSTTGWGPVFFGIMEEKYKFRLIEWTLLACSGVFTILLLFILKETRASVLLSRKAAQIRKETGRSQPISRDDFERGSFLLMMRTSLTRPMRLLFTEPIIIAFTIYVSFAWMCLYILLESISLVFGGVYGFDIAKSGYVFSTQVIGSTVGLGLEYYLNKMYKRNVDRLGPEARLYHAMTGGICMPVGAWIYAWTARASVHWVVPCVGISILYCGMYLVYLSTFSYIADSYTLYASSALSTQSFVRNLLGATAPLYTNQLYNRLGIAGGGSLIAGIATILVALPFLLFHYGERLRARSRFSQELKRRQGEDD